MSVVSNVIMAMHRGPFVTGIIVSGCTMILPFTTIILRSVHHHMYYNISNCCILLQTNISTSGVLELLSDLSDSVTNAIVKGIGRSPKALEVVDDVFQTVRRFLEADERFRISGADKKVCATMHAWSLTTMVTLSILHSYVPISISIVHM